MHALLRYGTALFGVLILGEAFAQPAITSWTLRIYVAGADVAQSIITITPTETMCNQPAPTTITSTVNPTTWIWDDLTAPGQICLYVDPRLTSLPDGVYEGTAQASTLDGASPETARVPFTRSAFTPDPDPEPIPDPTPIPSGCTVGTTPYAEGDVITVGARPSTRSDIIALYTAQGWALLDATRRGSNITLQFICLGLG